jgi:hypothetical protein
MGTNSGLAFTKAQIRTLDHDSHADFAREA